MALKFGRHFSADLYFCQNEIWKNPSDLEAKIRQCNGENPYPDGTFSSKAFAPSGIRVSIQVSSFFILLQIFTSNRYVAMDLFCWQPEVELQSFSEAIINLFEPQVVATGSRIRAEHLMNSN